MKNQINRLQQLLIVLCCVISFGFVANAQAAYTRSRLAVLSAKKGVIQKSGRGNTLTLTGLDPHVLWFTDRPNRKAGFTPTQQFIANWVKKFKGDPPNASLVHADMSYTRGGKQAPMVIELINPRMSGGVLRFDVRNLKNSRGVRRLIMNRVSLFVDGWCPIQNVC